MKRSCTAVLCVAIAACLSAARAAPALLPGFAAADCCDEQIISYTIEPGIKVHINAPAGISADDGGATGPTRLILYTLPNGNTTSQTIGKKMAPGDDWHYNIQHIGAQTRRLRELLPGEIVITVYLEPDTRSWPAWRKAHADSGARILAGVDELRTRFEAFSPTVALSGHSGGGSFIFGFINAQEEIPVWVDRIALLDANYGFDAAEGHGAKIHRWLEASPEAVLFVLAYDDRHITLDGKPVVSATGGTFRATVRMSESLGTSIPLEAASQGDFLTTTALGGRMRLAAHRNPDNKILHTVLVEKNGFIHAMLAGRTPPVECEEYGGPEPYRRFIY